MAHKGVDRHTKERRELGDVETRHRNAGVNALTVGDTGCCGEEIDR
jgi:hypothetical protein